MITRKAQKKQNRLEYGYRVILDVDPSTHSTKLPLNADSTEENSVVGAWVLFERLMVPSRVSKSGRALTSNVRYKELSANMLRHTGVTARVLYRNANATVRTVYPWVS